MPHLPICTHQRIYNRLEAVYEHLDRRLDACETGDLVISAVTLGELEVGFARSDDAGSARRDAAAVLAAVTVMPFDEAAARAFGRIQATACPRRGAYDRQTAAHAISLGVALVTNNEKDFNGIPDVVVENWILPPLTLP